MYQDVLRVVYSKLNPVQQLSCHHVFDEKPPSQFLVSKELLSRIDDIKGINGLVQLGLTTGEYEPCVTAVLHYARLRGLYSPAYESQVRADYLDYDSNQRITRLEYFIRYPFLFNEYKDSTKIYFWNYLGLSQPLC